MLGQLTPSEVDPRAASDDLWARYHELRRLRHAEMRPDDPIAPDELVEAEMRRPNPFDQHLYFEVSDGGRMLSWLEIEHTLPASPEHETNKHLCWANAYVRDDHRRQGIGKRWLAVLARKMHEQERTVAGMSADRESAHEFLKWAGCEPKLTGIESRLKLSEVDYDMMRRWVEEGEKRSPETRLWIHDGEIPVEMRPEFAEQRTELLNTMPLEDLDLGRMIVTPEQMREWYARLAIAGEISHDVIAREPDGTISGMTDITWAPYRRTLIFQQFTGVRPAARGRGIGKWIKAAMVLHAREMYPDAQWIATDNAGSNAPMLKINRGMGYKAYRTSVEYQIGLGALEARAKA